MTLPPAIEAQGLFKVFGRNPKEAVRRLRAGATRADVADAGSAAVIDASFTVQPGEIFVIMGLSGSGKSTVLRMLNGLLPPTAGEVLVQGQSVTKGSAKALRGIRQRSVSMVFQHFALLPHLTVLDNAAYALEIQGVGRDERRERAREILGKVGLGDRADAMPDELSGGMRQRVGLARALTSGTDILLMDEAFSALDPLIRREMQEQLIELQRELGRTIVFITHDLNEAMFLGDRIAVMRDGRIVQNGTPEEILTDPANDYVAQFVQDVDRARVLTAGSVMAPPAATTPVSAGVRGALRVMRDLQVGSVSVIENRRFLGTVTDRAVIRAVKDGRTDLRAIVHTAHAAVHVDDPLTDVVERAVERPVPVAVVDDAGRLVGAIPRVTLLAALGNVPPVTRENPVIDLPATVPASEITQTLAAVEQPLAAALASRTAAPAVAARDRCPTRDRGSRHHRCPRHDRGSRPMNDAFRLPLGDVVETAVRWMIDVLGGFFDVVALIFNGLYGWLDASLSTPPFWVVILVIAAFAYWSKGLMLAVGSAVGLLVIVAVGQWANAMDSLALVILAAAVAIAIAVPLGIWAARNDRVSATLRPVLDFLQTMPAFVYLIPAMLIFGVGPVPGMVATIVFALAPGVRLTELGIRGVDPEIVEAGHAFGASPGRILRQIQLPLALPSIMAGVNQVIMLSLSMVVIAGMVGAGGLGGQVVQSLSRIDIGLGVEAGLSVVILAMILDRVTSGFSTARPRTVRRADAVASGAPDGQTDAAARGSADAEGRAIAAPKAGARAVPDDAPSAHPEPAHV